MAADARTTPTLRLDVRLTLGRLKLELRAETRARRLAICGPSGAGKSSCLRILAGLEPRCRGLVEVLGERFQDDAASSFVPPWRRHVGWVPQDALLFPHRGVRENLSWSLPDEELAEVQRVAELLGIVPLLDRRPRNLSGGERQRVALGRALLARPRLLLLDEPLSALDRARRARVVDALDGWARERDLPLVLVTHDERDLAQLADEVWRIEDGRIAGG